jgi:Mpv17 / PMP22 family
MLWCNDMVEDRHCERAMQEIIGQSSSTVSHSLVQSIMNSSGMTSSTRFLPQHELAVDIRVRDRVANRQAAARHARRNLFSELSILVLLCCCVSTQSFCPRLTARRQSRLLVALDNDEVTNVVSVLATLKTVVTPDQVVVPLTKSIQSFFSSQPYVSAFVTAGVKASAADLVAQVNENNQEEEGVEETLENDPENASVEPEDLVDVMETEAVAAPVSSVVIQATSELDMAPAANPVLSAVALEEVAPPPSFDLSRNGAFLLYGGCYCGMFQELLFTKLYPVWFGPTVTPLPENVLEYHWPTIVTTVLFDNFLAAPFLCLPVLYVVKAFCTGTDVATTANSTDLLHQPAPAGMADTIRNALDRYKADVQLQGLLFKYWAIWLPVQCCTFSIVPMQYRVIFVAAVSFLWVIILSSISSSSADREPAAAMPQVD